MCICVCVITYCAYQGDKAGRSHVGSKILYPLKIVDYPKVVLKGY